MKQDATETFHDWRLNRGTGSIEQISTMVIPAGHNFDGATLEVFDSAVGFATSETSRGSVVVSGSGIIDFDLSTVSTQQFVRVDCPTNLKPEFGQLFLTNRRNTTTGPVPEWSQVPEPQVDAAQLATHVVAHQIATARDRWSLKHQALEAPDLTLYDDLVGAAGGFGSFYFWPPGDDTVDPIFVQLADVRAREQDFAAPSLKQTWTIELDLLEVTA
jgi:hypothetical protein